jgi:hypothetical protein
LLLYRLVAYRGKEKRRVGKQVTGWYVGSGQAP